MTRYVSSHLNFKRIYICSTQYHNCSQVSALFEMAEIPSPVAFHGPPNQKIHRKSRNGCKICKARKIKVIDTPISLSPTILLTKLTIHSATKPTPSVETATGGSQTQSKSANMNSRLLGSVTNKVHRPRQQALPAPSAPPSPHHEHWSSGSSTTTPPSPATPCQPAKSPPVSTCGNTPSRLSRSKCRISTAPSSASRHNTCFLFSLTMQI